MYTTPLLKMKRLDLKTKENIIVSKEKYFSKIKKKIELLTL